MLDAPSGAARTDDEDSITPTPPYGATVIVYRRTATRWEYLVLHRVHHGPDFDGEWAWGPPSGARHPDEDFDRCAARELFEETGLCLTLRSAGTDPWDWLVYLAEAAENTEVRLSPEHDRFAWLPRNQGINRVTPVDVQNQLAKVSSIVEANYSYVCLG